jgi:O-antigen ligase
LSLIFSLGIFSFFSLNRKYIKKYLFYNITIIIVFLLLYYSIDIVKEAIDIKTADVGTKNPRVEKWIYYLDVIFDDSLWRMFFGYGLIDLFTWYHGTTMHNTYIQIFISLGLVGLVSIVAFILVSVISIFLKYVPKYSSIQLALLSSVLVSILTIDMFYNSAFWIGLFLPFYSLKFTTCEGEK